MQLVPSDWRRARHTALAVTFGALSVATASAQQCTDFDVCTANDTCFAGECHGSFQEGASCDDGNPCTVNDRCGMDPIAGEVCRGVAGPHGTPCSGGCGTCQPVVGSPQLVICGGDPADHGAACDLGIGPCFEGSCVIVDFVATCVPRLKECPDTDGNPCTDLCDLATGECRADIPKCVPTCERCNPQSGGCEPANLGRACNDLNVCTVQSRCEFDEGARRTFCVEGIPEGPTPTRTAVPPTATIPPSPTVSVTRTAIPTVPPSPTAPAAPTATLPRATATLPRATATLPRATATLAAPSPTVSATPSPLPCTGDCNGDGAVLVSDVLLGVSIALGRHTLADCRAFDTDGSGAIEVHELIGGVRALLNNCA